jgi:hypothetical protein
MRISPSSAKFCSQRQTVLFWQQVPTLSLFGWALYSAFISRSQLFCYLMVRGAAQDRERFPVLPGAFEPFLVATQLCAWAIRHQPVIAYLASLLQRLRRVANNVARSLFFLLFLHQTENTQPFFPLASKVVSTRQWSRLAIERAKKFNHNRSGNPGA